MISYLVRDHKERRIAAPFDNNIRFMGDIMGLAERSGLERSGLERLANLRWPMLPRKQPY